MQWLSVQNAVKGKQNASLLSARTKNPLPKGDGFFDDASPASTFAVYNTSLFTPTHRAYLAEEIGVPLSFHAAGSVNDCDRFCM
jgi:hypothetical protein